MTGVDRAFWRGRKVFITGHTGFKGGWISLWLQKLGAEVTGFSLEPPTEPNFFNVARVAEDMVSIIGDIRDKSKLERAIIDSAPEIIFHMAAQPLVRQSYHNPIETYETNVLGLVNLFECLRYSSTVGAIVNITTDKVYLNHEWMWGYRETDSLGGYDPYSASKNCAEVITASYRESFFNPKHYGSHKVAIATARAGNVVGGGDWAADRLLPDLLKAFNNGWVADIRHPEAVRPWQHVLEPLCGYLLLAQRLLTQGPCYGEAWNFGPPIEQARSVRWIAERLATLWGSDARWREVPSDSLHETSYLRLDASKARLRLGWKPFLSLDSTLNSIVDWSRAYLSNSEMRSISLRQIEHYESLATT